MFNYFNMNVYKISKCDFVYLMPELVLLTETVSEANCLDLYAENKHKLIHQSAKCVAMIAS